MKKRKSVQQFIMNDDEVLINLHSFLYERLNLRSRLKRKRIMGFEYETFLNYICTWYRTSEFQCCFFLGEFIFFLLLLQIEPTKMTCTPRHN